MDGEFSALLRKEVTSGRDRPAIEYKGRWYGWSDIAANVAALDAIAATRRLPRGARVAFVGANSPGHIAAVIALLAQGACLVIVNSQQDGAQIAEQVACLGVRAVAAAQDQWSAELLTVAGRQGMTGLIVDRELCNTIAVHPSALGQAVGEGFPAPRQHPRGSATAVEMLTSGTTGPPKHIPVSYQGLYACAVAVLDLDAATIGAAGHLTEPGWSAGSISHISGFVNVCALAMTGRTMILREKFSVQEWREAIARHRLQLSRLSPAMVNMVLASDIQPHEIETLKAVRSGSAPISPETKAAFLERFSIPVLGAYGATEFGGAIVAWTLDLHRIYGAAKAASTGRVIHDIAEVRIMHAETGQPVPAGQEGLLEAKVASMNPNWVRTNDLAVLDEDDFVYIRGRADRVINRGGFKVSPEPIEEALRRHPAVRDAAVFAQPDARLGEIPCAAVELILDVPRPDESELIRFLHENLVRYHVPARILILDALPRTPSMKISLPKLKELIHV